MTSFFLGLDLGQSHDPTALVVVQKIAPVQPERHVRYECRHTKRLPLLTTYPAVVEHVRSLISRPDLEGKVALVLDYTGVRRPVADMFKAARLNCSIYSITIHGGDTVRHDRGWHCVPQRDLIGVAQVLLQDHKLTISRESTRSNDARTRAT